MAKPLSPAWLVLATCAVFLYLGFDLTMNLVHYSTWSSVDAANFAAFQEASGGRTVPLVAVLTLPLLALSVFLVVRPPRGIPRTAAVLALVANLVPLVATAAFIAPVLQEELNAAGPTQAAVSRLVLWDLLLRVAPIVVQAGLLAWFLVAQLRLAAPPARAVAVPPKAPGMG